MSENDATVGIVDVFADAVRVPVGDVRPGDYVFDTFGGRHQVTSVSAVRHVVLIRRDDLPTPDRFHVSDTITIVRAS